MNKDKRVRLLESSILLASHSDNVHSHLREIVDSSFLEPESVLVAMALETYRELMYRAQQRMVERAIQRQIVDSVYLDLISYLGTDDFLIQSNIYLRASRPRCPSETENIGWHRESFYGPNLTKSVNIWTPIKGVTADNSLRYIPASHLIDDSEIRTKNIGEGSTKRFSVGHKLGFNYDPKIIIAGVDLESSEVIQVSEGESALFSGNLIHGAAVNRSDEIRFSCDFQVIRRSDYSEANKSFHFSSGKPYFEDFHS